MNRSLSLLSAITLSSAALLSVQPQEASALAIAFDCFEPSTEKLVARSAVDMTSTAISCLPVPGNTITADSSVGSDEGGLEVGNTFPGDEDPLFPGDDDEIFPDEGGIGSVDDDEDEDEQNGGNSTTEQIADLIGDLIGKGINDLMR